jgi:uncharacterized protein (DUF1499 family)
MKRVVLIVLVVALLAVGGLIGASLMSQPKNVGAEGGRLQPCPDSPNCVSSQADDAAHRVEPLPLDESPDGLDALRHAILAMPRTRLVEDRRGYVHAEFRSRVFRFVDDLELLADPDDGVAHVRSASRIGYSDFGANRERVEAIRERVTR